MKRYRKTERGGGFFGAIEHEQSVAAKTAGILKLGDLIPLKSFPALIEDLTSYAIRDWSKGGKLPCAPVLMFKVLALQKCHGQSDDATKEQVFKELTGKRDQAELADSAYHSEEPEAHLIQLNAHELLMCKATRSHLLSDKEPKTHHIISRMHVRVEHLLMRPSQAAQRPQQSSLYNMDRYACVVR